MYGTEIEILPGGVPARMGCKLPDEARFSAVPTWSEANDKIPQSQWEDHDDFSGIAPAIKHQDFNNCTNASFAGLLELLTIANGGKPVTLSQVMLYWMCNGGQDAGAFCRDIAAKALAVGLCSDAACPQTRPTGTPTAAMLEDAKSHMALEIYQCQDWDDVGSALTRRFAVYHGFLLGRAFFNASSNGIVPRYDGSRANGHAQYSRGLRKIGGVWRTITPNSWGTSFGANGVGLIDESYFWVQSGNFVNLDCFAVRAIAGSTGDVPAPKM